MVTPLLIIAAALAAAFTLPLLAKVHRGTAKGLSLALTGGFMALSILFIKYVPQGGAWLIDTAGFKAPLSITLGLGFFDVQGLILLNGMALLSLLYFMGSKSQRWEGRHLALFFTLLLGLNGLIMTRDLFNLFVFMELSSISLFGILATGSDKRVFEGGFKYMIAGGIASVLYLVGVAFLYQKTGSLNLDILLEEKAFDGLYLPALLIMAALLLELKPFPANGWALDAYQGADNGTGALISTMNTTSLVLVLLKLLPLLFRIDQGFIQALKWTGGLTFLLSNLMAIRQKDTRRMLAYSSLAQTGLILLVLSFSPKLMGGIPIALTLLLNHALSKGSLFWLAKLIGSESRHRSSKEGSLRRNKLLLLGIGIGVSALCGLPPFPGFWAKWNLIMGLQSMEASLWVILILLGSFLEAFYLFRWFLALKAHEEDDGTILSEQIPADFPPEQDTPVPAAILRKLDASILAPLAALLLLTLIGLSLAWASFADPFLLLPLAALLLFSLIDLTGLPLWPKNILALAAVGTYSYFQLPTLSGVKLIFGLIFTIGSGVQLFILFNRKKDKAAGLLPLIVALVFSLGNLLVFDSKVGMFFSWELMTLFSFLLVVRGRKSSGAGLRYILFSLGGAFLILAALSLHSGIRWDDFMAQSGRPIIAILLSLGFLAKMGALGLHIWLPSSYAESEDEVSSLLSSVLSKAGLYMLFISMAVLMQPLFPGSAGMMNALNLPVLLGWLGVLTALSGALMALFQEDIKYTLAYSSMGQVGYMLLAFSLYSHLGWVCSLYMAINHLLFKGLLFLAVAGVIQRTGTRMMYQMGGLIKKMPLSFISVLIAIIALSGVPPLTGFGGKWLLYQSLMDKGWYLQAGLAMFASGVAFLYLFRLIHSIFLGQPKPSQADIKEAPLWGFIPQILFMGLIMLFSMYPRRLIEPLQAAVEPFFPAAAEGISWQGSTVLSSLGYWNGSAVMYVTVGVFLLPLIWLLIRQGKAQSVKQFNIVYAAERPNKPETTHYAFNFFSHYRKALGFLMNARVDRFWGWMGAAFDAIAGACRRLYSGNAQTYVLHIIIFILMLHLFAGGTF